MKCQHHFLSFIDDILVVYGCIEKILIFTFMSLFKSLCPRYSEYTAQKMKFPPIFFFSKCEKIGQIWSHLLKKSLMEDLIIYAVIAFWKNKNL